MRLSLLALAAMCAGCAGLTPSAQTQKRITEKPDVYNQLKPQQQGDILGGAIERGNTTDMVYLALGKPRKIVTSADGVKAMWVYTEYYSPSATAILSFNDPNSAHYVPGFTGATSPPTLSPVPWQNPASMGTDVIALRQSLTMPEMKSKTVYVFFFNGRVAEIKLDGDASDQKTAAANTRPRPKTATEKAFTRSAYGDIDAP